VEPALYDHRLHLPRIEQILCDVQRAFPDINARLQSKREAMSDRIVANMLDGYAFIDRLLAEQVDILEMGKLKLVLEINHMVLCGADEAERRHAHRHISAAEERFYDDDVGGIRDLMGWYEQHRGTSVWHRAAGSYVRILSEPQLFVEGNHRSGALLMSYILAREGKPPFVLTAENAEAYFRPSTLIRVTPKSVLMSLWRMPRLVTNLSRFLEQTSDPSLLLSTGARETVEPRLAVSEPT
jgi:hypothetical protein